MELFTIHNDSFQIKLMAKISINLIMAFELKNKFLSGSENKAKLN